jgi:hypothetical protein
VGLFVVAFKPLGELRGKIYGGERLTMIAQQSPFGTPAADDADGADPVGVFTLLARLSTYNQLSQIVRIADEEGFYEGETLSYITYAFIPRFLWSDKPMITPGQWFAAKLGKGQYLSGNTFSNAINMTIPGEFYLNFGWLGVVLGLAVESLLYYLYWQAAGFHHGARNPLGQAFTCILLMQASFNGSDASALVTLTVWYIIYLTLTRAVGVVQRRGRDLGHPPGRPMPPPGDDLLSPHGSAPSVLTPIRRR